MSQSLRFVVFDDPEIHAQLLPLTYTRPVGDLRAGIDTVACKWEAFLGGKAAWKGAESYMDEAFPGLESSDSNTVSVAGHIIPDKVLVAAVMALAPDTRLVSEKGETIALRGSGETAAVTYHGEFAALRNLYDIFMLNDELICRDFRRITAGRKSAPLSDSVTVIGDPSLIFLEEDADVEGAFINTRKGPVYVGSGAQIMEGSMLRGPVALCEHATVNMGTKIYGATTIGPWCKAGGELNNVVMQSYSNKAHDGFLGNAVIGSWCNIGAGCVASNLKNDYTPIRLWNYPTARFLRTGLQFCGLIMADHSKAGINTMFNTATVLGVGVNIHGSGFPRNFVPSFSEGSTAGFSDVSMTKFFETAQRMMSRRGVELSEADKRMFMAIREAAENFK
ncbi:MAG: glucose-1-phosphate thymidylyltransferase [Muribaculaceae bacterium]|nr:glucose-1-phosphate thymidylyltransferase [Muribaculaceae bacterium]